MTLVAEEHTLVPYHASEPPRASGGAATRVLAFAPHPDDEVFGCGGTLALHAARGDAVSVVILSAGEQQADTHAPPLQRLAESAAAAAALGVPAPECWHWPDRGFKYAASAVESAVAAIKTIAPSVIYAPSPWETHPDHRAAALVIMEAARQCAAERAQEITLLLYEVSAPLRPNYLVDISATWPAKQAAMAAFDSQNAVLPYGDFVGALNRYRALTLGGRPDHRQAHVEAFEQLNTTALRDWGQAPRALAERALALRGLPAAPMDQPVVSVVVRSMGRPTLARTLSSLRGQTWSPLQVVLVDASGTGQVQPGDAAQGLDVQLVNLGQRLPRAEAANAGLAAASGRWALLLDDDDWLYPDHIAKLAQALLQHDHARAAHTGVQCVDDAGAPTGVQFDMPYAPRELVLGNFLPIHGVLFERSLFAADGCRFDAQFDLYEDWDFWLQIEQRTALAFVGGISAAYRINAHSGAGVQVDADTARAATQAIFAKWQRQISPTVFDELVRRSLERRALQRELASAHRTALDRDARLAELTQTAQDQHSAAAAAQAQAHQARLDAHHWQQAHDAAVDSREVAFGLRERTLGERDFALQQAEHQQRRADAAVHAAAQHQMTAELLRTELAQALSARDHIHSTLNGEIHHLRHDVAQAQAQTAAERARHDQVATLLHQTHKSRSWRITAPLRRAGNVARLLRGAARMVADRLDSGRSPMDLLQKAWGLWRRDGLRGLKWRLQDAQRNARLASATHFVAVSGVSTAEGAAGNPQPDSDRSYAAWVRHFDTTTPERMATWQRDAGRFLADLARAGRQPPVLSIVMPVHNPPAALLEAAIASVQAQVYPHWQLCVCDDGSTAAHVQPLLQAAAAKDGRIVLARHEQAQHISHATNTALALATGEWVGFLDHDDELRPHAVLRSLQWVLGTPGARACFSDEDKLDSAGQRCDPYFKPDFNLGLLRSHNYLCHFFVAQRALLQELGGLRPGFEGAQDHDLALRLVDTVPPSAIVHVPEVLYHWRITAASTASGHQAKSYATTAGQRALAEHLQRRGLHGRIEMAPEAPGMYRVRWSRPDPAPLVSIIIPTRNGEALVRICLDSLRQTAYPNTEVIVVDNGSDDPATLALLSQRQAAGQIRVLLDDGPFNFSAINNRAVRQAKGELILLMNNDIEIAHPDWLDEMVPPALEPDVGCVGARLWYPDGRLQHGGVVLVCGVAGHAHKYLPRGQHGYLGRAVLAQDFVGVTAACLLIRRTVFDEVGGLDESLAVAFNDVDFCLRVRRAGYRNHWSPYASLVHHESLTRGVEDTPEKQMRFKTEIDKLQERWNHLLQDDPCYNPNLTITSEDFSLGFPPRVRAVPPLAQTAPGATA